MTRAVLDPRKIRDNFAESVQRIYGLYVNLKDKVTEAERLRGTINAKLRWMVQLNRAESAS